MADNADVLLRAVAAFWDDERSTLASLRGDESERWMTEGERLGRAEGALMRRVYLYLEQGPLVLGPCPACGQAADICKGLAERCSMTCCEQCAEAGRARMHAAAVES